MIDQFKHVILEYHYCILTGNQSTLIPEGKYFMKQKMKIGKMKILMMIWKYKGLNKI